MADNLPNIVLIYTDQQRYDALGANGNDLINTPNLDRMAQEGTIFANNYVTTPLCVPSRVGLFTGRYNHTNLSYNNDRLMFERESDFVDLLQGAGYHTGMVGKDHCFGHRLEEVFDFYRMATHTAFVPPSNEVEKKINEYRQDKMYLPFCEDPFPPEEEITAKVFQWAKDYVEMMEEKEDPFFLWISVPDPHPPYMVPEPYSKMYKDVDIPPPVWEEGEMEDKPYRQQLVVEWDKYGSDYPKEEDLLRLREIYWGMVSNIDDKVGGFLDQLESRGIDEDTLVVFTSDHGDYMGDHRMIRKGPHLYDALVHTPLIFRWPGKIKRQRTETMVCNIDLFPTICDFIEVEVPPFVQGESFREVLLGDEGGGRERVFLEYGDPGSPLQPGELSSEREKELGENKGHHLCEEIRRGRTKGVRTDKWKYCLTPGGRDELYDLESDPGELENLANDAQYGELIAEFKREILEWLVRTEDNSATGVGESIVPKLMEED